MLQTLVAVKHTKGMRCFLYIMNNIVIFGGFVTPERFTTMVANEGLERQELHVSGPPGPTT